MSSFGGDPREAMVAGMNDEAVDWLNRQVSTGSSAIPWQALQPTREAISLYREGKRDPELLMFLSSMFSAANLNVMRQTLHQSWQSAAMSILAVI